MNFVLTNGAEEYLYRCPHGSSVCFMSGLSQTSCSCYLVIHYSFWTNCWSGCSLSDLSLPGATVEPFGSFLSQLYTRWGDLDISIELSNGSYISTAAKKHKQTLLGEVLKALRRTGYLLWLCCLSFENLHFLYVIVVVLQSSQETSA